MGGDMCMSNNGSNHVDAGRQSGLKKGSREEWKKNKSKSKTRPPTEEMLTFDSQAQPQNIGHHMAESIPS